MEAASTLVREFILNEIDAKSNIHTTATNSILNVNNINKQQLSATSATAISVTESYEDTSDFTLLNLVIKSMINDPDQGTPEK